jgi:ferric-dicitrate binding protein FerR (iron transport regulator)
MHIDDLAALLKRYHEDKCTSEERKIVEEWYDGLATSASSPGEAEVSASLDQVFERIQMGLSGADPVYVPQPTGAARPSGLLIRRPWLSAAAVILLLAGVYALARRTGNGSGAVDTPGEDSVIVATAGGEIRTVTLPDGSAITLNANSCLTYLRAFKNREVRLRSGEAFFQIAPDPARPFIAEAGGLKTTVLGTSFNIRSYRRDSATTIALITGKVSVGDAKTTLAPGDLLTEDKNGGLTKVHLDRVEDILAWRQKAMSFRDASFADIAFEVENTYNLKLVNASDKKHWSYTGYFEHESVWEIIRTICITEHLDYRTDQGQVILINKN